MKIWAYSDADGWGAALVARATERGHQATLFHGVDEPDEGIVFLHLYNHPDVAAQQRRMVGALALNTKLTLIPNYVTSLLFYDRLEQARILAPYAPPTRIFYSPAAARRYLDDGATLPISSKTAVGLPLHRALRTQEEAQKEIRLAFSDLGIRGRHGHIQRGYLLWQEFVDQGKDGLRVLVVGRQRLFMRRDGGREPWPVQDLDQLTESALAWVDQMLARERLTWCVLDLARDKTGAWRALGMSQCQHLEAYQLAVFHPSGAPGSNVWNVLLDELEAGSF